MTRKRKLKLPKHFTLDWLKQQEPDDIRWIIANADDEVCEALANDWSFWSRPDERAPPGDWLVWMYLAGRGTGKTRSGCEWVRERVKQGYKKHGCAGCCPHCKEN